MKTGILNFQKVLLELKRVSKKSKSFRCEVLGWHSPTNIEFAGINLKSTCKRCGRPIMKDSQGNWFSSGIILVK